MSKVDMLEGSMAKLTVEISPEDFESAIRTVYNKQKKQISIPGFRKGKVPYQMVVRAYGKEVFYEDALNELLPDAYEKAVEETGLEVFSRPTVGVEKIEANEPVVVTFDVAVKPEVTLGEYKGLKKDMEPVEVTEEDVQKELESVAKRNARVVEITDRPVEDGDRATIDYVGTVDGVAFDGGSAEDYELVIGSHSFIEGFEEQLIGKNVGEEVEVNVTFPEDYHAKELAGKPAVFKVNIKGLKKDEMPEIDDEFAKDVSEFDTLEEYKEDLKKTLTERKEKAAETTLRNKMLETAVANASVEIPAAAIDEQCDQMIEQYAQTLSYQGMNLNQYMQYTGTTMESLRASVRPDAERQLKENLVLEAIAKAEAIEVTDEDVENEIADMAKNYGMEVEQIKGMLGPSAEKDIKASRLNVKALDLLVANAVD